MESKSKVSKAQQRAVNKYVKANYDRISVNVSKGKKATIQAHAVRQGESINAFINRAIDETMAKERSANASKVEELT